MDFTGIKKNKSWIILALIILFMATALAIRSVPAFFVNPQGILYIYDTDTWYNLRQIELMVHHFPQYNWFDPMTAYPDGKIIDWGPLYPFMGAVLCLITGATSHNAIVFMAGWTSPIMAVLLVPVMYFLGKTLWNRKAGIIAAGLVSVISFQFFFISSYGLVDHHIAEVLFSTIFLLLYICTIVYQKQHPVELKNAKSLILPVVLALVAGILYFLALFTSTTTILVLLVIAAYTFIQFLVDFFADRDTGYLLLSNFLMVSLATILFAVFGIQREGLSLSQYTIGIVYVNLVLIIETAGLYLLSRIFKGKRSFYLISLVVLGAGLGILLQTHPLFQPILSQALGLLSGSSQYSVTVQETLPWTLSGAFDNFNVALLLMAGGFLVAGYYLVQQKKNELIFLMVWTVIMLLVTIQFQRFVYYLTINVALLAGICIAEAIRWREPAILETLTKRFGTGPDSGPCSDKADKPQEKTTKEKKKPGHGKSSTAHANLRTYFTSMKSIGFFIIIALAIILVIASVYQDVNYGLNIKTGEISGDWIESLDWLGANTPSPGVDYFGIYDGKNYSYPPESYGVMAVWDAGHWITFFAHRIPIANPFQNNLDGAKGTAAFFLSGNESQADTILEGFRGKYVITDSHMAVDTFTGLVPWISNSVDISPYIKWFMVPDTPANLVKVHRYDDAYFQTQVVRLHNFDGSMTEPTTAEYIQYVIRKPNPGENAGDVTGYARVITNESVVDISHGYAGISLTKEGSELDKTHYANIFSDSPDKPVQKVPALRHYRLIHESPDNASVKKFPESGDEVLPGIKSVKIFEYVKGAHIPGDGIIEVPVVTGTGRTFVYRQESSGGEFVVPYSTTGGPMDVRTTGPYHISGTTRYITVTEKDVEDGNRVTG
nr:oligosaccharyl transferase, archaeosortase A system-associated [uncultured Methanoregula sp.]